MAQVNNTAARYLHSHLHSCVDMGNLLSCQRRYAVASVELGDPDALGEWWARLESTEDSDSATSKEARARRHRDIMRKAGFDANTQ